MVDSSLILIFLTILMGYAYLVGKGFLLSLGDSLSTKFEAYLASFRNRRTAERNLSDKELHKQVGQLAQSITRNIYNGRNRRPKLNPDAPFESVDEQLDREVAIIEQFLDERERVEKLYPFETIKEEFQARGSWDEAIDELWEAPKDFTELRELVRRLGELRKRLHT